jgi:hypothetical protein
MNGYPENKMSEDVPDAGLIIGIEPLKKCKACGELKSLSEFYRHKQKKDGHNSFCKACGKEQNIKWRIKNPKKVREYHCKWYAKNSEKIKEKAIKRRIENPEKVREKNRRWKDKNPGKYIESYRRATKKRRSTLKGKLHNVISCAMRRSLKGSKAGRHWEMLVGYTIDDLKKHLEKQFQTGMTWGNYSEWQIDHRIPISAFNFNTPEDIDFKKCWALKNLQPMWAIENFRKHNKINKPFQPSFAFSQKKIGQ